MTVKISCIFPTARDDHSLLDRPNTHLFEPTFRSLENQSFKDFELIIVDALYGKRDGRGWISVQPNLCIDSSSEWMTKFSVKYVPVHRSFWLDRGMWAVAAGYNTGIIHADGELLVFLNDCCEFDSGFLERYWGWYEKNYWASALLLVNRGGKPSLTESGERRKDSRWIFLGDKFQHRVLAGDKWYGYSSCSLKAALGVNGFDENFDGCKSLEDPDFGMRLEMLSGRHLIIDRDHTVIENEHDSCSEKVFNTGRLPPKCNWAILQLNSLLRRAEANKTPLTQSEVELVRKISTKYPCSHVEGRDYDLHGAGFDLWASNQPRFSLEEKRERRLKGWEWREPDA